MFFNVLVCFVYLYKFNGKNFTQYKGELSNKTICALLEDFNGAIWIGTSDGLYKLKDTILKKYSEKDGLIDNVITSLYQDSIGNLWIGTKFGLNQISYKSSIIDKKGLINRDVTIMRYTNDDGFLGKSNQIVSLTGDKKGNMLLITGSYSPEEKNTRLIQFTPNYSESTSPNIQLTEIKIFNEDINWLALESNKNSSIKLANGVILKNYCFDSLSKWYLIPKNLSLAYDNNHLSFNYLSITMNQPDRIKYKYILKGYDPSWSLLSERNQVTYKIGRAHV